MINLSRLPHRHHFFAVLGLSCALLVIFTFMLYRQTNVAESHNQEALRSYEVLRRARLVLLSTLDLETGQRGYLLTGSENYLQSFNTADARLDDEIWQLKSFIAESPEQLEQVELLEEEINDVRLLLRAQIDAFQEGGRKALTLADIQESKSLMDNLRENYETFAAMELSLLQLRLNKAAEKQQQYFLTLFLGGALAVAGLLASNLFIMTLVARSRSTEEALRQFEEGHRMVMEGVSDGIYDYYPETGAVFFSPSYERLLGYPPEEMPASIDALGQLIHPDDAEAASEVVGQFVRREIPSYSTLFRMRHRNGSWRWILSRGVGVWDERGVMRRMVGTHTDITEQKEREEELRQLNADLEGFAYIASHDLRAPLVNLKGFAGEIRHAMKQVSRAVEPLLPSAPRESRETLSQALEEDIPESLDFIGSAVEKMDTLTTAILDLSRIGQRRYQEVPVDVGALVKRTLDSLAYEIGAKGIDVACAAMPEVMSDPLAIEQIFSNILDNAIKYLDPSRPGRIAINARRLPQSWLFSIEDNGRGIAVNDFNKVFDIFRRAGNSGDVRGAGMGMAFVKATVRKLGGRIWFESHLGQGTVFHFTIPNR